MKQKIQNKKSVLLIVALLALLLLTSCKVKRSVETKQSEKTTITATSTVNADAVHISTSDHATKLSENYTESLKKMNDILTNVSTTTEKYAPPDSSGKQYIIERIIHNSTQTDKSNVDSDNKYTKRLDSLTRALDCVSTINSSKDYLIAEQNTRLNEKVKTTSDSKPNWLLLSIIAVLGCVVLWQNRRLILRLVRL